MSNNIIEKNEEKVKDHLGNFVRETVEETLNAMLETNKDLGRLVLRCLYD